MKAVDFSSLLKRPELITFVVAALVSGSVALGLPARAGLELSEGVLTQVVTLFFAVFVGAVVEGKYRGADYAGGLAQLVRSSKFRMAVTGTVVMILTSLAQSAGIDVPVEALETLINFVIAAILGVGGLDAYQASRVKYGLDAFQASRVR